jgi:D-alanyl-D-alanine carboxypeptidase
MPKFVSAIFLILIMAISTESLAATSESMNLQLTNVANKARETYKLPALAISIYLPSHKWVEVYQGYVGKDSARRINENTLFQVGSTTKTFTAALILKLAEMKKLNLNDPVGKWLSDYPKWSQITLLQLLNHTSGIYDYIDNLFWWIGLDFDRSKIWVADELANLSYEHPLYFQPGSGWHYSNADYVLLGMIVEKITHMSFKEALNFYVLSNIQGNMKHTYYAPYPLPPDIGQHLANGYRNGRRDMTKINTSWLQAGGAIISNAHDLTYWYSNIFSHQIVTDAILQKMINFVSLNNGRVVQNSHITGYGLGIFSMATPYGLVWFTPGLTPGYTSLVAWLPCHKIAFSYTTNSAPTAEGFHSYLIEQILKIISDMPNNIECINASKVEKINFPKF